MANDDRRRAEALVLEIDEALQRNPTLTEQQLEDIAHLRAQLLELCQSGEMEEAKRCHVRALTTIRSGAPVPE
jgi:uncharacterized protein YpuA (DUF1002 family)